MSMNNTSKGYYHEDVQPAAAAKFPNVCDLSWEWIPAIKLAFI